jgi:hypothetical protein
LKKKSDENNMSPFARRGDIINKRIWIEMWQQFIVLIIIRSLIKNINIKFIVCFPGITFHSDAQNRKIGKTNTLKFREQ